MGRRRVLSDARVRHAPHGPGFRPRFTGRIVRQRGDDPRPRVVDQASAAVDP